MEKVTKWFTNTLARTLEPGAFTSFRKVKDAFFKQPSPSGTVREMSDVAIGASTGIKPFNVNILESLSYKISNYTRIRTNVYKAEKFYKFNELYRRGGDVLVEEFIDIQKEAFRLQKQVYNEIQAAKKFDLSDKIQGISKIHGQVFETKADFGPIKIIPFYHPAVVVYNENMREILKKDFKVLNEK